MLELALPNTHALAVMLLIVAALFLFSREAIPLQTTSLLVLVALTLGFAVFPFESDGRTLQPSVFFLGFGHKALIAVCALMIVGQGLIQTGALEPVGRYLGRLWRRVPAVSLLLTVLTTMLLSAFVNDTPVVVLMMPILIGVAMRTGQPASGTLIPMGFAAIVGGMTTTIGTSTNLLIVNVAADLGMAPFSMFDYTGPAAIGALCAALYLWLVAPRILPPRQAPMSGTVARLYTAQIRLGRSSVATGSTLADALLRTGNALRVESVQRGHGVYVNPLPDVELRSGDRITTSDTQDNLREFARQLGGTLYSGDHAVDADHPLSTAGQQVAEVVITPSSGLIGRPIGLARLRSQHGLRLLALNRFEESQERKSPGLDEMQLQAGDVLLVQSTPENLRELKQAPDFLVLDGSFQLPSTRKAPLALLTMLSVIALAAFNVLPIEIAAVLGCAVLILTGCLSWKDAMNALSAPVILIIVSSLAMGSALLQTGGADYLAKLFVYVTFGAPPAIVLASLMLLMGILTNIVTNNAAAVIGTPIAIGIAQRLGLPLEPFVLAVVFGANLSFVTPMAYQTHLLLMNAAGYKFGDFVRVGLPLALGLWLILTAVLVWAYGL
jgi:di/tricarboxylate transporter